MNAPVLIVWRQNDLSFGGYLSICDLWSLTPAGGFVGAVCSWYHYNVSSQSALIMTCILKHPSPQRRRSAAVGTKLKLLLLLMESDRTVVPPRAHLSCSSPHYFRDNVITGLINAAYVFCLFKIGKKYMLISYLSNMNNKKFPGDLNWYHWS